MPIFRATIRKEVGSYDWVNGYSLDAADLATAALAIPYLVEFEQKMHLSTVVFKEAIVADQTDPLRENFLAIPLSGTGVLEIAGQLTAPPNIVAFVKLGGASGRPGKKFYRYAMRQPEYQASGFGIGEVGVSQPHGALATAATTLLTGLTSVSVTLRVGKNHTLVITIVWGGVSESDTHKKYYDLKHKAG